MISIIITAFREQKTIGKAIESFVNQDIKEKYELIVSAPDNETLDIVKKYNKKNKKIKIFKDPGKGKTYALNLLLPKLRGEIIILSDGDVYVSNNSINDILEPFKDKKVGCTTGQPISINSRKNMLGYWSHLLCNMAHKMRLKRNKKNKFLECSGYLWAFRNNVIKEIPRETAEDTIVPCLFFIKGYKIKYVPEAKVHIKFPDNLRDFLKQKKRTAGGHETLGEYIDLRKVPRMKSLKNEILESYEIFNYPKNLTELRWTVYLFPIRFYIWISAFLKVHLKRNKKVDGWDMLESTK